MTQTAATGGAFDVDPVHSIGYLIRDTSRLILARLQILIEPHGVTLGQYFILRELWENEGITQRELSVRIGIQEPSTAAAIDGMEGRDLVVRVRSKQDRRKIHVYLTARGRGLRNDLLGYSAQIINGATQRFEAGDIECLRGLLQRLKTSLEQPST